MSSIPSMVCILIRKMNHRTNLISIFGLAVAWLALGLQPLFGQDLEPGAYSVAPTGVNIIAGAYAYKAGDVSFAPSVPIEDASASIHGGGIGYVRSLSLFGRSANIGVGLPGVAGHVEGVYIGDFTEVERLGFADLKFRFAANLFGAPAMNLKEFSQYRQITNIGTSLVVVAPTGQYDSSKLINLGTNRWSFKPEFAISQAVGKFTIEFYAGVWFFTDNTNFFNGKVREQEPIGSSQFHLLYTIKRRMWIGFNANFYRGGTTIVDGTKNLDLQENSRFGATLALPITPRESLKISYSRGAFTTIGADFHAFGVSYTSLWGGGL